MKKLILLVGLSVGLVASDAMCVFYGDKATKGIRLITADLKNNDIQSARNNLVSSKIWLDAAIMECNGESYEIFMDYKTRLLPKVENILRGME
mgnify:FL=1